MRRCCQGQAYVESWPGQELHRVRCTSCDRVLALVEGPREEVFADL